MNQRKDPRIPAGKIIVLEHIIAGQNVALNENRAAFGNCCVPADITDLRNYVRTLLAKINSFLVKRNLKVQKVKASHRMCIIEKAGLVAKRF